MLPMKFFSRILFAGALLAPAALIAASFEGKVSLKMTSARNQPQTITYNIKGDKIRIEMPGQSTMGGLIMDTTKKETMMIMDQQKMYMVMAMPDPAASPGRAEKSGEAPTLKKTGESERILGYLAEKYVSTFQNATTDLWLAEGLGAFMSFSNSGPMGGRRGGGGAPTLQAWERALAGKDLFPLRVVGHDKEGQENFRMEVTAIEKAVLPETLFAPPTGYQKLEMGNMMQGMMPGGMPGGRP